MKIPQFTVLCAIVLLTIGGGTGCRAYREAREEKAMRAIYGDGYEQAKAEMDAARSAAWMLSWEKGPPVTLPAPPWP